MRSQLKNFALQSFGLFLMIGLLAAATNAQQSNTGTVRGRVVDAASAVIVGSDVTAVGADGAAERKTQTNQSGEFNFALSPGKYTLRVSSPGFTVYEKTDVTVIARRSTTLDVTLSVAIQEAQVTVGEEAPNGFGFGGGQSGGNRRVRFEVQFSF